MKTLSAILAAAALTSACASSGLTRSDQRFAQFEPYVGEPVRSITAFRPQSWQPISRTQLILWTNINDAYLLTVMDTCPDLMYANSVKVSSTGSSISNFDHVTVRGDRCPIRQIQPIDVRRMKADRNS